MALKKLRPLTPGQRFKLVSDNADITAGKPEKSLLVPVKKSGGRDNTGKMTRTSLSKFIEFILSKKNKVQKQN